VRRVTGTLSARGASDRLMGVVRASVVVVAIAWSLTACDSSEMTDPASSVRDASTPASDEPAAEWTTLSPSPQADSSSSTSRRPLPAVPPELIPGQEVRAQLGTHCGVRILGRVNGRWWRAAEATETADWLPSEWAAAVADTEIIVVKIVLSADHTTITASSRGRSVVYTAGADLADSEYCA